MATEADGKTSTFILHHDRCTPAEWTLTAWKALADFARTGSLQNAATLSRHGLQLVSSDRHTPIGGTLEHIGYVTEADIKTLATDDLDELCDDDVTPLVPVYRGPTKYAATCLIGDEEGNVEGREYEIKNTEAEAAAYLASVPASEPAA